MGFLFSLLAGCGSDWKPIDIDGDGYTIATGDCWEEEGEGSTIHPSATEIPYNDVDENCDGVASNDADGDGYDSAEHGGDDCWDDPDTTPDEYVAVSGAVQLTAIEVNPGRTEKWYDGIDQDCRGDGDFDQDLDGYDSDANAQSDGSVGEDCNDTDSAVSPAATEIWYDGVDQDCDGWSDSDQDFDNYDVDEDCDDTDPTTSPAGTEIWGNCVDEDCDGNFADQDRDGWLASGTDTRCPGAVPAEDLNYVGDCVDDPNDTATGEALNGFSDVHSDDINPGEYDQPYDGVDADCGNDDDFDADDDSFATNAYPNSTGVYGDDCADDNATIYPSALDLWYDGIDADCRNNSDYDQDGDGFTSSSYGGSDCDDTDLNVNPGAVEACNSSVDLNCDGRTDVGTNWYADSDRDSYGDPTTAQTACDQPGGYVANSSDCDDTTAAISPAATEVCDVDDTDEDCDGLADDADATATGQSRWYADSDYDNYGSSLTTERCDQPVGYAATSGDCNDSDDDYYPGAAEGCDPAGDFNCDGVTATSSAYYQDGDNDGYGNSSSRLDDCTAPTGYVANSSDCDDTTAAISPAAAEVCDVDDIDEDCDGLADDADPSVTGQATGYLDADRDGYGTSDATTVSACAIPAGYVTNTEDCDDSDGNVNPAESDIAFDGIDSDCNNFQAPASSDTALAGIGTADARAIGADSNDQIGSAAALIPDTDGDGLDEIVLGSPTHSGNRGKVYFSSSFTGDRIVSDADHHFIGDDANSYAGYAVDAPGDVDGDGIAEVIVGAPFNSTTYAGAIYLITDPYATASGSSLSTAAAAVVDGDNASDYLGWSVGAAGDVNGDGQVDIAMGIPRADDAATNAGAVALFYGSATLRGNYSASSADVRFTGESASDLFGSTLAGLGDLDGDGFEDIGIGAPSNASGGASAGAAYVAYADSAWGSSIAASTLTRLLGDSNGDMFGSALTGAGDITGDGYDDAMFAGHKANDGWTDSGKTYVVIGSGTRLTGSSRASDAAAAVYSGSEAGAECGSSVAGVGDVNGDGFLDSAIGCHKQDASGVDSGITYVVFGPPPAGAQSLTDGLSWLASLRGEVGGDGSGSLVRGNGDLNGDGFDDFVIGAPRRDETSFVDNGVAAFIFGSSH